MIQVATINPSESTKVMKPVSSLDKYHDKTNSYPFGFSEQSTLTITKTSISLLHRYPSLPSCAPTPGIKRTLDATLAHTAIF